MSTQWQKSPPELVDRFGMILELFPELQQRKMFGYPAAFAANGHMVTGLHGTNWMVRLSDTDLAALGSLGGAIFEPMVGRPMKGFLALPNEIIVDDDAVGEWIGRAQAFVATLRPKKPKKRKKPKA
jgi:hypothetical protein